MGDSQGVANKGPLILYDGDCGLCHGFVQYVLARDNEGIFRFSPLQGESLKTVVAEEERSKLPDSIVVLTEEKELLLRSDAVVFVLSQLPGTSQFYAQTMRCIPRVIRDLGYRAVASIRKTIFKKPEEVCPLVPLELRSRFLP